jgi:4a-hydroxytetrahydrobiopterin dehydratase
MRRSRKRPQGTTTHIFGGETLQAPDGWSTVDGRLMREFTFDDFNQAKAFIDSVSDLCNALDHHAELHFGWGYAVVETFTHDTQSITSRDVQLASAINAMEESA